ncbi:MAG: heavy-metal-associated domain-containing protein [Gemmatimonadetes bacterium]|nr:heavy-metal-associated domain-containing protein [Gemmatimonadota bacterium]
MIVSRAFVAGLALILLGLVPAGCGSDAGARGGKGARSVNSVQPQKAVARAVFAVQGMTCTGCEIGVKRVLKRVPGVVSAEADYETGKAWVEYDPASVQVQQLVEAIGTLGYSARPIEESG